jgi:L-threonine-O-3-phosphate decarboxylase
MPFSSDKLYHHGGNLRELADKNNIRRQSIIDFSASINPLGPIPELNAILDNSIPEIMHYPDYGYKELRSAISRFGGWDQSMIVPGNGASELIYASPYIHEFKRALIAVPSYNDYTEAARRAGIPVEYYYCDESNNFQIDIRAFSSMIRPHDLIIIGRPNNPTCTVLTTGEIESLCIAHKESYFVIDESFIEFTSHESIAGKLPDNVLMIRSMTKFYAIPGLRLGYAVGAPHHMCELKKRCIPWGINCIAAKTGIASLENSGYQSHSREAIQRLLFNFFTKLNEFPELRIYPTNSNFFLVKLQPPLTGELIHRRLICKGIAIRQCTNFIGLDDSYIRIAVRTEPENAAFTSALDDILKDYGT